MEEKRISKAVISRLPRYYRYLGELIQEKVERISSKELSIRMKVTASQIRQDLNNFGGFGQQGYGYNVKYLHNEIGKILGIDRENNFERRGFYIKAIFDIDPEIIGKEVRGVRVYSMDELEDFIKKNDIHIAALAIPKLQAEEVAKRLVAAGIVGIWNYAHIDLQVPDNVVVENVHLSESLMRLSYRVNREMDKTKK